MIKCWNTAGYICLMLKRPISPVQHALKMKANTFQHIQQLTNVRTDRSVMLKKWKTCQAITRVTTCPIHWDCAVNARSGRTAHLVVVPCVARRKRPPRPARPAQTRVSHAMVCSPKRRKNSLRLSPNFNQTGIHPRHEWTVCAGLIKDVYPGICIRAKHQRIVTNGR